MTVSALVHLSLVAFVVIYTEVRPFRPAVEKTIPVDVVVDEKQPDLPPIPQPSPEPLAPEKPASPSASAPAAPPAASPPPPPASRVDRSDTLPQTQPQAAANAPSAPSRASGYTPPQPDLTVKYHVMLGLPEDASVEPSAPVEPSSSGGDKHGEGGDTGPASDRLGSSVVDALRRHLKDCSKLPTGLSPSDNVAVKLRVQLKPNGRLAAEPALIEGTASMKGVQLMRGAIAALSACQPYAMLPAERYGEWKVLDLSFTPRDFNS